jgi:WD40 repeat protein
MTASHYRQRQLKPLWQEQLTEYISSIATSKDGKAVAASSAAGEVAYWLDRQLTPLLEITGATVDCLCFDASDRYLAAGGQMGDVRVWDCHQHPPQLCRVLAHKSTWIDAISWHPHQPYLAFAAGRFVQIWDIESGELISTLDFDLSTVFDLAWHPAGTHLAVAGNSGARIWQSDDWDEDPQFMPANSTIKRLSWSPQGDFLAGATLDRCLLIGEISALESNWVMTGFPARIEQLAWIDRSVPTIAVISAEELVVWNYDGRTWKAAAPSSHRDFVADLSVHPTYPLVATASVAGEIAIWQPEMGVIGSFNATDLNFTNIVWHPQDRTIITGSEQGKVTIWG